MYEPSEHLVSVAPMMKRTDRHFRWMMRQITRHTLLYTEMIPAQALVNADPHRFLDFDGTEHPVALQIGGDDPGMLASAARLGEQWGYDEINLNVGCPSPRVQSGNFGACLMQTPEVVAECVTAMREAVKIPVTVKHRIGVDDQDDWEDLIRFVDVVACAGSDRFTVHARKAWLKGLSPKENRNVPPLRPELVYRLKAERPALLVEINGHIHGSNEVAHHLEQVDAVMIGRAAYDDPFSFADFDERFYDGEPSALTRQDVVAAVAGYATQELAKKHVRLGRISQHLMNLFAGQPGARAWRRFVTTTMRQKHAEPGMLTEYLANLQASVRQLGASR